MYGLISLEDVSLHSKKINYLHVCIPWEALRRILCPNIEKHSKKINYLHVCIPWEALRRILCPNIEKQFLRWSCLR
jgi:hypothetical protein